MGANKEKGSLVYNQLPFLTCPFTLDRVFGREGKINLFA